MQIKTDVTDMMLLEGLYGIDPEGEEYARHMLFVVKGGDQFFPEENVPKKWWMLGDRRPWLWRNDEAEAVEAEEESGPDEAELEPATAGGE